MEGTVISPDEPGKVELAAVPVFGNQ